ncbi:MULTISPECIES: RrF2 family transcriptional regulator [Aphanothece]|uniref:RrF2 family transcriptional regulator n=1 Tax=Aphanothece TaxID=1121 RepID=UPI0039851AFF
MAFSAKTEYGLVALIELAGVHGSGGLLQTAEICRRHGIPERYLEQMLTSLRKAGILRSVRGPRGGFQLNRAPDTISVAEVIACLDGDRQGSPAPDREGLVFRVLASLERKVEQARHQVLSTVTLAKLVEERDSQLQASAMFYI